ncbi:MAG: hypothetical protein KY455_11235 [Euryarchaeota archaeon]|nr:hypothetical protein [Euryarchaeota archaeon]
MLSTTVRIRPEDKARLDRLQARYLLKTGKRLALDAVLHRMIEVASRHEDEVILSDPGRPLTVAEKRRILSLPYDFGVETTPQTIDEELYGTDER